jgi:predicted ATP-grasp superfamily ATP-dependent carboligase
VDRSLAFDKTVPVLTLKVGDYALHHVGLAIARTFGRVGVPVYGIHEDRLAPAGLSRYTTGRFLWTTGDEGLYQRQLLDGLQAVAERIGRRAVLIPTDDHAAIFIADHEEVVRRNFLIAPQSSVCIKELTDKAALYARCLELDVTIPAFVKVDCPHKLEAVADETSFPVVVKRGAPLLLADGRRAPSTRLVSTREELLKIDVSSPIVVQEYIPAEYADDWLFHAYCNASSECLVAFTGRKLRGFPSGAGETAIGRAVANPALESLARSLMRELGYCGVVSLDYRFDHRENTFKLLDFNPRVGAIFRLFQSDTDVDVVRALHLDLTGRSVPPGRMIDGRTVAVESHLLRLLYADVLAGHWLFWKRLLSWRNFSETAWLAGDDLLPAVMAAARSIAWALRPSRARRYGGPRYVPGRNTRAR